MYYEKGRKLVMTKKIFIIIIIFNFLIQSITFAKSEKQNIDISFAPKVLSEHCICIERTTKQILFEKDAYSKCPMASTTKILTAIIIIENCDLNEKIEISKTAANVGGSTLGIIAGQKITIKTLLYGLLLRSGNDTAVALAEYVSGSVEEFSNVMNKKAKEIGLKNSNFVTPHGLDNADHYTTAYDLAILTDYALNNKIFLEIVGTKQTTMRVGDYDRVLNNTNELLGNVNGVYGVKTGFTGNAGRCLVTACKRGELDIIIIVLKANSKNMRGEDTKKIIEYVFENFKMVDTEEEIEKIFQYLKNNKKFEVVKALSEIKICYKKRKNYICPLDKNKLQNLRTSIYCFERLEAPLKKDAIIGKIRLICDSQILYEIDICVSKNVDRIDWKKYIFIFVKKYITFYSI